MHDKRVNPRIAALAEYPFPRLRRLLAGVEPGGPTVDLTIGEPQGPLPDLIRDALRENEHLLTRYPMASGDPAFRESVARWIQKRYGATVDPATMVLPLSGSREGLFAFGQAVLAPADPGDVAMPNPMYGIYEGSAILAGARPVFFGEGFATLNPERVRLAFVTSPTNPEGDCFGLDDWRTLFDLADRYGWIVAADEPYSELWHGDTPPIGAAEAATKLGRGWERLVIFNSLSKRSSAAGLRSGFVAGDPALIAPFLAYRQYHGAAPSLQIQAAATAAWSDETHVAANRESYTRKVRRAAEILPGIAMPEAGFFLWAPVRNGEAFTKDLWAETGVKVLPGEYLGREGVGRDRVRVALVPDEATCDHGLRRLAASRAWAEARIE